MVACFQLQISASVYHNATEKNICDCSDSSPVNYQRIHGQGCQEWKQQAKMRFAVFFVSSQVMLS
ncbi:hypothetical protein AKJ16_DCAP23383 [Drosera capensis]